MAERQVTHAPHGHVLANAGVWSPDGRWLNYDVRSDPAGSVFDGTRIERVEIDTGRIEVLYESRRGACCGVPLVNPADGRVAFILGPEHPAGAWTYGPDRRQGVIVDPARPGIADPLEARDLAPPFTPGALRGGTHVHQFDPAGDWVSFTYDDHLLPASGRVVAVAQPRPVAVPRSHPRNHDGAFWSAVVTEVVDEPRPGSDEIGRACEEAWIAGSTRRLAFLGAVRNRAGRALTELFVVELPDDLLQESSAGPLAGTPTTRLRPPPGCRQRRLTHTELGLGTGLPRFWPRSSPDGKRIAFLARRPDGVVELHAVSAEGGTSAVLADEPDSVESAFTWSADGRWLGHVRGGQVCVADTTTGRVLRLTAANGLPAPRPEACVFSPDGRRLAYVRNMPAAARAWNQLFVCDVPAAGSS